MDPQSTQNTEVTKDASNDSFMRDISVHCTLAHSYLIYFGGFVLSILGEYFIPNNLFFWDYQLEFGFLLLTLATILSLWAQKSSRHTFRSRNSNEKKLEHFMHGPYKYTRTPTQLAIAVLMIGFGFIAQSLLTVVVTIIMFIVMKFTLVKKEEKRLTEKYGEVYEEYKEKVVF